MAPKLPREAVFVEPRLVAEVEFREWTQERVMRAPSFKGLREDKPASEVVARERRRAPAGAGGDPDSPEALFDEVERLPEGALSVSTEGRQLRITNWDKVLYPETGFTKGDLIAYYARVGAIRAPAPARPPVDAQAVSERRRRGLLLREAVALAPA